MAENENENNQPVENNDNNAADNDGGKSTKDNSFLNQLKKVKQKKHNATKSWLFECIALVAVIFFASWFKPEKYAGQHTSLMYYYEPATVTSVEKVDTDDGKRWCVVIEYVVADEKKRKQLLYKHKPDYSAGDTMKLKIQTINPDRIEIEGKE